MIAVDDARIFPGALLELPAAAAAATANATAGASIYSDNRFWLPTLVVEEPTATRQVRTPCKSCYALSTQVESQGSQESYRESHNLEYYEHVAC